MQEKTDIQKRIVFLSEELNRHSELYYQQDKTEITDFEFDTLLKELSELEGSYPELALPYSPTHRVGGRINKDFETIAHKTPMLSLSNTYDTQEIIDFDLRVKKAGHTKVEYVCELKYDGLAISLSYEDGILTRGVTRGDGNQGDDITDNIKTIRSIPLRIKNANVPKYPRYFEVRGEVFFRKADFEVLNKKNKKNKTTEQNFANPRNAASGTLKLQDSSLVAERPLSCFVYALNGVESLSHFEDLETLRKWGLPVADNQKLCKNIHEVIAYLEEWEEKRHGFEMETDGVVIKVNAKKIQTQLGSTAKSPRWAIAYKYPTQRVSTVLEGVDFQVGRTGAVTPVARLKPVALGGTIVKKASLHNMSEIVRLGVAIGDIVEIEKSGEIIPKVVQKLKSTDKTQEIVFLKTCPECGSDLDCTQTIHYCKNHKSCKPQLIGQMIHFVSRKAMNIDHLGKRVIEQLYDENIIRSCADLYDIRLEQIQDLERFGERSANRLIRSIQESKKQSFDRVLFALGIRHIGLQTAEQICANLGSLEKIKATSVEEFLNIPGIGEQIAHSLFNYFRDKENLAIIKRLQASGLQFEIKHTGGKNILDGKTFVITGVFESISREGLQDKIKANGGKVVSSVSAKLNYLVVGSKAGASKLSKANKLRVQQINEQELFQMLEAQ